MTRRALLHVTGIVQGVGFRPFVYNTARSLGLAGWVKNTGAGVEIELEGSEATIDDFVSRLQHHGPPLAQVDNVSVAFLPATGYTGFEIRESTKNEVKTLVSPDMGTCRQCRDELFDPADRRYRYPFINCTNCGPRFTIVERVPYDRPFTTMKEFPMCSDCAREYHDPVDRRFHAQPNACPVCGPSVRVTNSDGMVISPQPWETIKAALNEGKIIAVKGIGGYHLCCDALNPLAVSQLRERKVRWDKPFAVMMPDIETIEKYCVLSEQEKELIISPKKPIVLLQKKTGTDLPEEIAPGNPRLGVMLPYTPLHYLLLEGFSLLVMTSGNVSDEPIAYEDEDALCRLRDIADLFLLHNRAIFRRCDDSVAIVKKNRQFLIRRSRGYAPSPLRLPGPMPAVLACGGEQKNTFCLTRDDQAFLSHHIGDLENLPTLHAFETGIEHFKQMFEIKPEIIAYDLHPEYLSTKYALEAQGYRAKVGVQHHHAHVVSCLADNLTGGPVIGVSFDGTGYGTDGHLWGGEFLLADYADYRRLAHFAYVPMPGGSMAIREPWRMAAAYLDATFGPSMEDLQIDFMEKLPGTWAVLRQAVEKRINTPLTSSCGRLFDGVAALLGVKTRVNYEGQAAVELEQLVDEKLQGFYPWEIIPGEVKKIDWRPIFRALVQDIRQGTSVEIMAAKFHYTISNIIVEMCQGIRQETGMDKVALTGGVFQNMFLLDAAMTGLEKVGFEVLIQSRVPCNDGGLALGQALVAYHQVLKQEQEAGQCV